MRKKEGITERLVIKNFFSIAEFTWVIKDFNVLTGGVAAGKSLCIKLAYFFESILNKVISGSFKDEFTKVYFYTRITNEFNEIFHSQDHEHDYRYTNITYTFEANNREFDLSVKWDARYKRLKWKSKYIDSHIEKWYNKIKNKKDNDEARRIILENINAEFRFHFPIMPLFFPATRAITSIIDTEKIGNNIVRDKFFRDFIPNTKYINNWSLFDKSLSKINKILHPYKLSLSRKLVKVSQTAELIYRTTGRSKRVIEPLEMSSGQQEVVFLLALINHLDLFLFMRHAGGMKFFPAKNISLFIEEPSTHLFPQEQKTTIEFIIENFRILKDDKKIHTKVFLTTHSPYTLNVLNNALFKGKIIKDHPDQIKKINKKIKFHHLFRDETTAFFIEDQEKCDKQKKQCRNMMNNKRELIFASEIAEISYGINRDTNALEDMNEELKKQQEEK